MPLGPDALLEYLTVDALAVAALVPQLPVALPVPSCPGWTAGDLVRHLGSVHRWAAEVVRTRAVVEQSSAPDDTAALAPWFGAGVRDLLETLRGAAPGEPCWGFGPPPRLVEFWVRRQALETSVHRWDVLGACGLPAAIGAELAQDGVDEVVSMMFPRQVRLGRIRPLDAAIALTVTETGASWVLGADGVAPPGEVVASVSAPAASMFLLLWHRLPVGAAGIRVEGDHVAAERSLRTALTP